MKITWPWKMIAENIREKQRERCLEEVEKMPIVVIGVVNHWHVCDVRMAIHHAGKEKP